MVNVTSEQAKAIADLVSKIQDVMTKDHIIVGIPIDGVPIVKSIAYALKRDDVDNKSKIYSFLAASSKYDFIDNYRLNEFRKLNQPLIFVDWHTVSGKLGCMLKDNYPNSIYAVLSDPNNKADICATTQNIPKFDFGNYMETLDTIGLWVEPDTIEEILKLMPSGGELVYHVKQTAQSNAFYKALFRKIDEVLAKND